MAEELSRALRLQGAGLGWGKHGGRRALATIGHFADWCPCWRGRWVGASAAGILST